MSPETIFTVVTGATSLALGVATAFLNWLRSATAADRDEWKAKNAASREEIHTLRGELGAKIATMQADWEDDKIELAKLRQSTNFDPVNQRLSAHIESQGKFNEALVNRLDKMAETQEKQFESQRVQNDALIEVMRRLVPIVSTEEIKRQEEPL